MKIPIFPISGVQTPALKGTPTRMFLDKLYHMALPLSVMVFTSLGGLTRYVRATMIERSSSTHTPSATPSSRSSPS